MMQPKEVEEPYSCVECGVEAPKEFFKRSGSDGQSYISSRCPDCWKLRDIRLAARRNHLRIQEILELAGARCVDCGTQQNLIIDHKKPLKDGGKDEQANREIRCCPCHKKRHHALMIGQDSAVCLM